MAGLLLQLRRSTGDLLRLPSSPTRVEAQPSATGSSRICICLGLRPQRPARRNPCGSNEAQGCDPWRVSVLESHLRCVSPLPFVWATALLSGGRRSGRITLLPCIDFAHQRLSQSEDPLEGPRHPCNKRLRGHSQRGFWAGAMAEKYGWRFSFKVLGVLGCILGVALIGLLKEVPRGSAEPDIPNLPPKPFRQEISKILRTPTALTLMLVFICANFVALVLLTWMPAYLYGRFHLSLAQAALTATLYPQAGSMCGAFFGGFLADKLSQKTAKGRLITQAIGVLAGVPFVVICGLSASLSLTIAALICWGFLKGMYDANIFASIYDVVRPAARGTTSGLMNCTGWMIGGGTAPLVVGFLSRYIGLGHSIALSGVAYLIAGALLVLGMRFLSHDLEALRSPEISESISMPIRF